jgi:hypothetical protein
MSNSSGYLNSFTVEKGRSPSTERYLGIDNSPFLKDEYKIGMLKLRGGKVFNDQQFKFNMFENKIEYLLDEKPFELTVGLEEFGWNVEDENTKVLFRSESTLIKKSSSQNFYQVLIDGDIKLLKQYKVEIKVVADPIALGVEKKEFSTTENYFILKNEQLTKIRRDKKSVFDAIGGDSKEINAMADQLKTKFNSWDSIKELITNIAKK